MANVPQTSNGSRCRGKNRRGEPCQCHASEPGGFCIVHAGKQSMSELGRRGGRVKPTTKLRANVDDELREKARRALEEALDGSDEKRRFEAAKSLFSYRAAAPPHRSDRNRREASTSRAAAESSAWPTCSSSRPMRSRARWTAPECRTSCCVQLTKCASSRRRASESRIGRTSRPPPGRKPRPARIWVP